jgi:CheY-like chemotaxis protein/HPt (histidine-containing phosphotransfer) domain-containing protein
MRNFLTFGRGAPRAVIPEASEPATGSATILIIDDHADSLHAMSAALGRTYRVDTADSAASAIRRLSGWLPDLILLDVRVPAVDGTRLAHRLLADEELAPVPMVAVTEMTPGGYRVREAGGVYDGHFQKPIDMDTFAAQVRELLRLSAQDAPRSAVELAFPYGAAINRRVEGAKLLDSIEKALPDSQFAPGVGKALHQLAEVAGGLRDYALADYLQRSARLSDAATARSRRRFPIFVRICRELIECDPDSAPQMAELRTSYLDRRRAELGGLEQAVREGNFAAIRKTGHNLKGTGAAYGFAEISDIGRSLEAAAKNGDAGAIEILLDRIDGYLGIVRPSSNSGERDAARI